MVNRRCHSIKNNIHGNTLGLKASQLKGLERIYRRRVPTDRVITPELTRYLAKLSQDMGRQIGLLLDRKGTIRTVVVGDKKGIFLPDLSRYRSATSRLSGLRLIHTHLRSEPLSRDDLTDLALLRLDLIAAITVDAQGLPGPVHMAHLVPKNHKKEPWKILEPLPPYQINLDFLPWIQTLETEIARSQPSGRAKDIRDRAILIRAATGSRGDAEDSLEELKELCRTDGIDVLDVVLQRLNRIHPRSVIGEGKLKELVISALQAGANLIVFDQELSPSQARSIANLTDMRVVDRTQLILDIFAQHAMSREGKAQVELAQLRYLLPRLSEQDAGLSRLTGGIGGRGPGETKLEISRRRTRERIHRLEKVLRQINRGRNQRRAKRVRHQVPIISIVGYTNAGKSTLLNALTESSVVAENKLFATLDTATRRLRFPREREVIITDTVGFIRNLPKDLLGAFRATLDELRDANLLLHVVDLSNNQFEAQMEAVEKILSDLDLLSVPSLLVFNKIDQVPAEVSANLCRRYGAIPVSASRQEGLNHLTAKIEQTLWNRQAGQPLSPTA